MHQKRTKKIEKHHISPKETSTHCPAAFLLEVMGSLHVLCYFDQRFMAPSILWGSSHERMIFLISISTMASNGGNDGTFCSRQLWTKKSDYHRRTQGPAIQHSRYFWCGWVSLLWSWPAIKNWLGSTVERQHHASKWRMILIKRYMLNSPPK